MAHACVYVCVSARINVHNFSLRLPILMPEIYDANRRLRSSEVMMVAAAAEKLNRSPRRGGTRRESDGGISDATREIIIEHGSCARVIINYNPSS